jgi:hypothetical protein
MILDGDFWTSPEEGQWHMRPSGATEIYSFFEVKICPGLARVLKTWARDKNRLGHVWTVRTLCDNLGTIRDFCCRG